MHMVECTPIKFKHCICPLYVIIYTHPVASNLPTKQTNFVYCEVSIHIIIILYNIICTSDCMCLIGSVYIILTRNTQLVCFVSDTVLLRFVLVHSMLLCTSKLHQHTQIRHCLLLCTCHVMCLLLGFDKVYFIFPIDLPIKHKRLSLHSQFHHYKLNCQAHPSNPFHILECHYLALCQT